MRAEKELLESEIDTFADLEAERELLDKDLIEFYNNSKERNAQNSEQINPTALIQHLLINTKFRIDG